MFRTIAKIVDYFLNEGFMWIVALIVLIAFLALSYEQFSESSTVAVLDHGIQTIPMVFEDGEAVEKSPKVAPADSNSPDG